MNKKTITEDDVEMWLTTLHNDEINDIVDTLDMNKNGRRLEKLVRLQKWLSGDYSEADFQKSDNRNAEEERKQARLAFLNSCCGIIQTIP